MKARNNVEKERLLNRMDVRKDYLQCVAFLEVFDFISALINEKNISHLYIFIYLYLSNYICVCVYIHTHITITGIYLSRSLPSPPSGGDYNNDLAIVKLKPQNANWIQMTRFVTPVCLPTSTTPYTPGTKCQVSGWGLTDREFGVDCVYCFVALGFVFTEGKGRDAVGFSVALGLS